MPLTPEEEKRRKAGDKDALGYFDQKGGAKNSSAFGTPTTTEAPGVSAPKKKEATDYRGTTYKNRPDIAERPNLGKEEYKSRRKSQYQTSKQIDRFGVEGARVRSHAVGNLKNFDLRGFGRAGAGGNSETEVGKGKAILSKSDAKGLVNHGRHTASDVLSYAQGLNEDGKKGGFAGVGAMNFLQKKTNQTKKSIKKGYLSTAEIGERDGNPRATPKGLDPDLAKEAFQGKDFGNKDMKRYEKLYKDKYGTNPPKGTKPPKPGFTVEDGQIKNPGGGSSGSSSGNTGGGNNTTANATSNKVGGNKYENILNDSMNNNSGVITNDFSDNRISFQSGSNTYNFGGGSGSYSDSPASQMAMIPDNETLGDSIQSQVARSAVNMNLQKQADKGFNPSATAIANNKTQGGGAQMDQLNDYLYSSPQFMFDQSDIQLSHAMGNQAEMDGYRYPKFTMKGINDDKDKD